MKYFRLNKRVLTVLIFGIMLVLMVSIAQAATAVDTFDTNAQASDIIAGVPCSSTTGSDMLGGARDILVTRTFGVGSVTADVTTSVPNSFALSIDASTRGTALIQWDGNDGSCALDATVGLGGINVNPYDGVALMIRQVDLNAVLQLRVYTSSANYSILNYTIPNAITPPGYVIYFPFDQFTPVGTGADYTNVHAAEVLVDGTTIDSLDMTIDFVNTDFTRDFGDLPAAYGVTLAGDNGASHIPGGIYFGTTIDTEPNGQESATANGDNTGGSNDEDGLVPVAGSNWGDGSGQIAMTVTKPVGVATACVVGWIDWDQNNAFDLVSGVGGVPELVTNAWSISGSTLNITTPTTANYGVSYPAVLNARFRVFAPNSALFTTYGLTLDALGCPTTSTPASVMQLVLGGARDGEVEDYQWGFSPTAVSLQSITVNNTSSTTTILGLVSVLVLALVSVGVVLYRRQSQVR